MNFKDKLLGDLKFIAGIATDLAQQNWDYEQAKDIGESYKRIRDFIENIQPIGYQIKENRTYGPRMYKNKIYRKLGNVRNAISNSYGLKDNVDNLILVIVWPANIIEEKPMKEIYG